MSSGDQWQFIQELRNAIQSHADALIEASKASENHARSLNIATWFLGFATVALFLAAVAQVVVILVKP